MGEPRLVFSLPFPLVCPTSFFPLCVHPFPCLVLSSPRVVVATHQHCALLCCFLSSLLFLCVFHHHHPSSPLVCVKRVCVGKGKEDEQTCVIQKACGKMGAKRETEDHMWCQHLVTNPGPNHTHTPFTSLFSPQVLFSSCCGLHSFSAPPFLA